MQTTTLLSLSDMMENEESLDDIQEAPDFIQPPAGIYKLKTISGKIGEYSYTNEGGDDESGENIQLTLAVEETIELISDKEPPVPDGSLFMKKYKGTVEDVAKFKRDFRKIADLESLAGMTFGDMFELAKEGLVFKAVISYGTFKQKDGTPTPYMRLRFLPVSTD